MRCAKLPPPPFSSPMPTSACKFKFLSFHVVTLANANSFSSHAHAHAHLNPNRLLLLPALTPSFSFHSHLHASPLPLHHALSAFATATPTAIATATVHTHHQFQELSQNDPSHLHLHLHPDVDVDVDDKERLRRSRISRANKGNIPWNKGKKHTPETLQRIRERTKIAMQNPKIKMKLLNLGHTHSEETKTKIGDGVKEGWRRRRQTRIIQEGCHVEWCNVIAEAARVGFYSEKELFWNSYELLQEELEREWIAKSVQKRQPVPRVKGPNQSANRSPHSLEQRRKIAEAIRAKWADPDYRDRVRTGMIKHYGFTPDSERKQKKKTARTSSSNIKTSVPSIVDDSDIKSVIVRKVKKNDTPTYKDPNVTTKLEIIKKVKDQRHARERKKREAAERAKLLIAEAEKAAKALEAAAEKNPLAEIALKEARYMIAQATQMLDSIEQRLVPANSSLSNVSMPDLDSSNQDPTKLQINGTNMINTDQSTFDEALDGSKEAINGCRILFEGLVGDGEISRVEEEDEKSEEF